MLKKTTNGKGYSHWVFKYINNILVNFFYNNWEVIIIYNNLTIA